MLLSYSFDNLIPEKNQVRINCERYTLRGLCFKAKGYRSIAKNHNRLIL